MSEICVFAGTAEGRRLINGLSGRGARIVACVATEYGEVTLGEHPDVEVRAGRLDREAICEMLKSEHFDVVVDATHPYAEKATETISYACNRIGTEYLRLLRSSDAGEEDGVFVSSVAECIEYLRTTQGNILLTTGSKTLPEFCSDDSLLPRIYARVLPLQQSLDTCSACSLPPDHIIAMQGPFSEEMNTAMIKYTDAAYLVTKETGNAGGYAEKIRAARLAGATAVIIGRPTHETEGMSADEAISLLERRFCLAPVKKKVILIGTGMGGTDTRTLGMERAIRTSECIIGAERMLEGLHTGNRETFAAVRASEISDYIRNSNRRTFSVLLSGDTGFYSGAKALLDELTDMDVSVLPGIGSLSYFCARLKRPWENVRAVSLHGRECDIVAEVRENQYVFSLLGGDYGASDVLNRLNASGLGELYVHIGERLGYADEKITSGTVSQLSDQSFKALAVILIENKDAGSGIVTHGIPDELFCRDEVPMTKSEVRSVSLSKLELQTDSIVYDIGAGSGSVAVECALQARCGKVFAVEMKENALQLISKNVKKFAITNVNIVAGTAPDVLAPLPAPSHAFIGGSTGNMRGIIDCLLEKNKNIRIVANAVTLETVSELTDICKDFSYSEIAEISVSRGRKVGKYNLMTAQNPVYIFTMQNVKTEDRL